MKVVKANGGIILVVLLIFVLSALCLFCSWYSKRIVNDALLQERYAGIVNGVDMLAVMANNEDALVKAVEYIDDLNQVYAALYKADDGNFILLSSRVYETSVLEPFDYIEFYEAVNTQESGHVIIGYTPEGQSYREMLIYFKWIIAADEKYIVAAGVSEHSITAYIDTWVFSGQATSALLLFMICAVIVFWAKKGNR